MSTSTLQGGQLDQLLQKNPLPLVGTLDRCWLFTFRTTIEEARRLLPDPLEPVTYRDHAFWNVVVTHVRAIRPKYVPDGFGLNYWHVAYRLYASFQPMDGSPRVEGLYFVRSDCDEPWIMKAGNVLTHFNFHLASIRAEDRGNEVALAIESSEAPGEAELSRTKAPQLSPASPFGSLEEAAAFLQYQPQAIGFDPGRRLVNVVRIVRNEAAWRLKPVHVHRQVWGFLRDKRVEPELCFEVEPIVYEWSRGQVYQAW